MNYPGGHLLCRRRWQGVVLFALVAARWGIGCSSDEGSDPDGSSGSLDTTANGGTAGNGGSGGPSPSGGSSGSNADATVSFPALGLTGVTQDEISEAYCKRYATEVCAARANCCSEPPEGCELGTEVTCALNILAELYDGNTFDSDRVAAIFARLDRAAANCGRYEEPRDTDPFGIRFIPRGERCDEIEERFGNEQCEGSLLCDDFVCSDTLPAGEACTGSDLVCADGFLCRGGVCSPPPAEGDACGIAGCIAGAGLVCASNPIGTTPTSECTAPRPAGGFCQVDAHCASGFCNGSQCSACSSAADCDDTPCSDGVCIGEFDSCDESRDYGR